MMIHSALEDTATMHCLLYTMTDANLLHDGSIFSRDLANCQHIAELVTINSHKQNNSSDYVFQERHSITVNGVPSAHVEVIRWHKEQSKYNAAKATCCFSQKEYNKSTPCHEAYRMLLI